MCVKSTLERANVLSAPMVAASNASTGASQGSQAATQISAAPARRKRSGMSGGTMLTGQDGVAAADINTSKPSLLGQ